MRNDQNDSYSLRDIVAEAHKCCGTDFLDLSSLDPLWITPAWDIKNGISKKMSCTVEGQYGLFF